MLQGEDRCSSSGPGGVVVAGVVLVEVVVVHLVVVHVSGTGWVENNLSAEIENLRDLGLPPGLVLEVALVLVLVRLRPGSYWELVL